MTRQTVLVVDDDPDMRLYLRGCLRGLPSVDRVIEASDGREALERVRSGAVDVVVSDVVLSRMDGRELCRAIKDDPATSHVPVLLISGQEAVSAASTDADGFLAKPFNARRLRAAVTALPIGQPDDPGEGPDS
ncbi:MAG: response regulator [Gemmatimonadota bacterium]|nr:response regulator [Gemmatimonadota bacterium]